MDSSRRPSLRCVSASRLKIGKLRITAEVALRFAAALDVPIQELLQTDTPPEIVQQRKPSRKVLERLERIESLPRRKAGRHTHDHRPLPQQRRQLIRQARTIDPFTRCGAR